MTAEPVAPQHECTTPGCHGIKAPRLNKCLVHADDDEFQLAVRAGSLGELRRFDLTGTPLTQAAIDRILDACPTDRGGIRLIDSLNCDDARPVEPISIAGARVTKLTLVGLTSDFDVALDIEMAGSATLHGVKAQTLSLTLTGTGSVTASGTHVQETLNMSLQGYTGGLQASPIRAARIAVQLGDAPDATIALEPFADDLSVHGGRLRELRLRHGRIGRAAISDVKATNGLHLRGTELATLNVAGCTFGGVNLINAQVKGDVSFTGGGHVGLVNATGLAVDGELSMRAVEIESFTGLRWCGLLDLAGCVVAKTLELTDAQIRRLVLDGITVNGAINFSGVQVVDHASLRKAHLAALREEGGIYNRSLCLDQVDVSGDVTLRGTTVSSTLGLEHAHVEGDVELAELDATVAVSARKLRVGGTFILIGRAAELDLTDAEVEGPATIHVDADQASLANITLRAKSELRMAGFQPGHACALNLRAAEPRERTLINGGGRTVIVDLEGARCDNLQLRAVSLERCLFDTATGLEELRLTGDAFARKQRWGTRGRVVLAEDPEFTPELVKDKAGQMPPEADDVLAGRTPATPKRMADRYRGLRSGLEDSKDSAGAAEFYFAEMQMRRRAAPWYSFERAVLVAYRFGGGYGVRPLAPALCLLALLLSMTAIATAAGAVRTAPSSTQQLALPARDCRWVRTGASATLRCPETTATLGGSPAAVEKRPGAVGLVVVSSALGFNRTLDSRLSPLGQTIVMISRILGAALLAFLILGLRSMVRR